MEFRTLIFPTPGNPSCAPPVPPPLLGKKITSEFHSPGCVIPLITQCDMPDIRYKSSFFSQAHVLTDPAPT